jgi:hypothetical protein
VTGPDRVFLKEGPPTGHRTGPGFETGFLLFKKSWVQLFFFRGFRRVTGKGMVKAQSCFVASEEVLEVESKCPFLPINPTYDQYVHRLVSMSECEVFHVLTRSVMKELLHDDKCMVLHDKWKKSVFFKIRVDV